MVSFAVHPLHNPALLSAAYQPLADLLGSRIPGIHVDLEASRDYRDFEAKIQARKPALLLPNPWQALQAMEVGYEVIAMAGDREDFRGILLVRRDSGITTIRQLKGRRVSYPSPTALAACIMPQMLMRDRGLDVMREVDHRYVGSQESSMMNVYLKLTEAGATWPTPWRGFQKSHPAEARDLRVLGETPALVNNAVMVRKDLDPDLKARIRAQLIHLHEHEEGRRVLGGMEIRRFHPAKDADYEPVRAYVARFERLVRPVVQP